MSWRIKGMTVHIHNQSSYELRQCSHKNLGVRTWPFKSFVVPKGNMKHRIEIDMFANKYAEAIYQVGQTRQHVKFVFKSGMIRMIHLNGPHHIEMNDFIFVNDKHKNLIINDVPDHFRTWMSSESISNKTLCQLCIPATHNSGASWFYTCHILGRYFLCQDLSVYDQCNNGIRFLDFRVSNDQEKIYVSHRFMVTSFQSTLTEVAEFLLHRPTEIIIVHIKKDWDKAFTKHDDLKKMIEETLGDLIIRDCDQWMMMTLNELRNMGKRVLLITDLIEEYVDMNKTMSGSWPSCHDAKPDILFQNFNRKWFYESRPCMARDKGGLSITDCVITPDVCSVVKEIVKMDVMLREGAQICNQSLRMCLQKEWKEHFINIIALDFPDRVTIETIIKHNDNMR